jgi:Ca2+-binding RTX toxin-like protein
VADGGPGDDTLTTDYGPAAALSGGDGNDHLIASYVTGAADGGAGNDVLETQSNVPMLGGPGDDRLVRHEPDCATCDTGLGLMDGGEGDDTLEGSSGSELMSGGPGADTLHGRGGHDILNGGDGNDVIDVGGPRAAAPPDPVLPDGYVAPDQRPQPFGIADGGSGDDLLKGGPNRDELHGGDGNDTLDGGDGNDRLDGGPGQDLIAGGPGKGDLVDLTGQPGPVTIGLGQVGGDGLPGENDTYEQDIERFILSDGNDRFVAGAQPVSVYGGLGNDVITGSPGHDELYGDTLQGPYGDRPGHAYGQDRIDGRSGDDTIDGDAGSDVLRGGAGDDHVDGGRPVIYFVGTRTRYASDDTIYGGPGNDTIRRGWRVSAGPGDDTIDIADFHAMNRSPLIPLAHGGSARCGSGDDSAKGDYYDELGLDCETVSPGTSPWSAVRARRDGTATLKARCAWDYGAPCRGRASLIPSGAVMVRVDPAAPPYHLAGTPPSGCERTLGRRALAGGGFDLRAGRVNRVTIRLDRAGRRSLQRAGCLLVRAVLRFSEPGGYRHEMARTLALRAPR